MKIRIHLRKLQCGKSGRQTEFINRFELYWKVLNLKKNKIDNFLLNVLRFKKRAKKVVYIS